MGTAAGGGEPDASRRSLPASIRRQGQKGGNFLRCIAPPCCFERPLVVSLPLPWGEHKAEASSGGADLKTEAGLRCLSEASFYFWPLFYSREAMVFFFLAAFRRRQDGDGDQPVEAPFAAPSSLLYGTLLALKTMSVEPH